MITRVIALFMAVIGIYSYAGDDINTQDMVIHISKEQLIKRLGISVQREEITRVGLFMDNTVNSEGQFTQIGIAVCNSMEIADSMFNEALLRFEMGAPRSIINETLGDRSLITNHSGFIRYKNVFVVLGWKGNPPLDKLKDLVGFLSTPSSSVNYGKFSIAPAFNNIESRTRIKKSEKVMLSPKHVGFGSEMPNLAAFVTNGSAHCRTTDAGEIELTVDSEASANDRIYLSIIAIGDGMVFHKQNLQFEIED